MRTFRTDACVLIAFYFETADLLTAQARLRTIRSAMAHCSGWDQWKNCIVGDHFVTVRFADIWKNVDIRLHQLMKAHAAVTEDPEILGGTPIMKGTRVPVYDIAAAFDSGTSVDRILKSYPNLKDWQVELASVYARAVPPRSRPKCSASAGRRRSDYGGDRIKTRSAYEAFFSRWASADPEVPILISAKAEYQAIQ
jgi:uncharacterized protein (DUF433 family)